MNPDFLTLATQSYAWRQHDRMCGISGVYSPSLKELDHYRRAVVKMCEVQHQRGPDASDVRTLGSVVFGHNRLSIIDLDDRANQPMLSRCGRYLLVYNGEIYNYKALRSELEAKGINFRTASDTEVLLEFLIHFKCRQIERLNGIFAFGFYDLVENELTLARDRFGIKPLYLRRLNDIWIFASTVKALQTTLENKSVCDAAEQYFWLMGNIPRDQTYIREITVLKPGTVLTVKNQRETVSVFFSLSERLLLSRKPVRQKLVDTDLEELREVLWHVVRQQSISDVPSQVWLSSGIDSSLLLYAMQEQGLEVDALTVGFQEYRNTPDDETALAAQFARRRGVNHQCQFVDEFDFEEFCSDMDQPTIDGVNTWLVSKISRKTGHKVTFTGVGADELFIGYPSFSRVPALRTLSRFSNVMIPRRTQKSCLDFLASYVGNEKIRYLLSFGENNLSIFLLYRAANKCPEILGKYVENDDALIKILEFLSFDDETLRLLYESDNLAVLTYLEIAVYMQSQLLRDIDWASMAHSVEARVPYLDNDFVDFILEKRDQGKIYTKLDLVALLPESEQLWFKKKKTGFTTPVRSWVSETNHIDDPSVEAWQSEIARRFFIY